MINIMFLCHGNICRSPMAEYVMKDLVENAGLNPIYPPAQRKLREKGVRFGNHSAHKISLAEFEEQDLVIVMDRSNLRWLERIVGDYTNVSEGEVLKDSDIRGKVHMMMEFAGLARDVADPWYTGDFEQTYQDVLAGCKGLLAKIKL